MLSMPSLVPLAGGVRERGMGVGRGEEEERNCDIELGNVLTWQRWELSVFSVGWKTNFDMLPYS